MLRNYSLEFVAFLKHKMPRNEIYFFKENEKAWVEHNKFNKMSQRIFKSKYFNWLTIVGFICVFQQVMHCIPWNDHQGYISLSDLILHF